MLYRVLILPIAGLLLALAADAYVGLVAPGAETAAVVCCLAGLALSALWTWSGVSLSVATAGLSAISAAVVARVAPLRSGAGGSVFSSAVASHHLTAGFLAFLSFSAVFVAVLYGWLVVHRQQPWPAIALAGGAILMRADVSATYADRFPWFMAAALLLVLYTYAPTATSLWSSFPAAAAALFGIVLAWQLPTLVPAWSAGFVDPLARVTGTQTVSAPSSLALAGPFHPSDQPVMTIHLSRPNLAPYWRGSVFDTYDGRTWTQSESLEQDAKADQPLIRAPIERSQVISANVRLRAPATELVAPGVPIRVDLPAQSFVSQDGSNLVALTPARALPAGAQYTIQSVPSSAVPGDAETVPGAYLQLPPLLPRVTSLAWRLTASRGTEAGKVAALASYLRDSGRFRYDSQVGSDPRRDAVDDFLFRTRRGYCNQFATSLAVMARVIGIPSRLVSGYATGTYQSGSYLIRARDAHSWVEVNLPASGWVQVDPTPGFASLAASPGNPILTRPQLAAGAGLQGREPSVAGRFPYSRLAASSRPAGSTARQRAGRSDLRLGLPVGTVVVSITVLLALLALGFVLRPRSLRQMYRSAVTGKGWRRRQIRAGETPLEFVQRLPERDAARAELQLIAELYARERYGGIAPAPSELTAARRAWRRLWGPRARGQGAS